MKRQIHILPAEGGKDSELFAKDLAGVFSKLAYNHNWTIDWIADSKSIILELTGRDLTPLDNESGGIRIQRVPPTEKCNRTHTSTVTVAVMSSDDAAFDPKLNLTGDEHFAVEWFSGTGAGGQHRNKHQNSCRVIHLPTGISESRQTRSREDNLRDAKQALLDTLARKKNQMSHESSSIDKKGKLGSGMRGDKFITIQFQNDKVTHHRTGKTCTAKQWMKGHMELLW